MSTPRKYYAVVRHCADGYDWIDSGTVEVLPELSKGLADKLDSFIPQWAQVNKQVRVATVNIIEVSS